MGPAGVGSTNSGHYYDAIDQIPSFPSLELTTPDTRGGQLKQSVLTGNENEINRLLESGVNVYYVDEFGETALLTAIAFFSPLGIIKPLLRYGASADFTRPDGRTPLHLAVSRHNVLDCLIRKSNTHLSPQDNMGDTPLVSS